MSRTRTPRAGEQADRLETVKVMVRDLADAMPTMARELRRNAIETLDDVIADLRGKR